MTDPTAPQPEQPVTPPPAYQPPVYEAPGYQTPGYQQPGYATPGYAAAGPRTNTLAIVALVLGFVIPIGGIIAGHIALSQIKRTGEAGHGLALAGTILGYVFTGLGILLAIIYVIIFAGLIASGAATGFGSAGY